MLFISNGDKLKSWNDGPVKQNIIDFLNSSVEVDPNYIKPENRIATFDNDGTLWAEKPMSVQLNFIFRAFIKTAKKDPSLMNKQPYKSVIEKDKDFFHNMLVQTPEALMSLEKAMAREWTGKTPDEFDSDVTEFFETVKPAKYATNFK